MNTNEEQGIKLSESHKNSPSRRAFGEGEHGHDILGVAGERVFADRYGLVVQDINPQGRDDGYDFKVDITLKIDVKTAKKAKYLLVPEGKVNADIYVLVHHTPPSSVIVGWAWAEEVMIAPVEDKGGRGIMSHFIHWSDLNWTGLLDQIMSFRKKTEPLINKENSNEKK